LDVSPWSLLGDGVDAAEEMGFTERMNVPTLPLLGDGVGTAEHGMDGVE
jgi:hypothetical protein